MNRKTTTSIIGMLVLGGLISVAYASTTIITDTGITTTNLTVLGTCTGCGVTEGSFSSYATILNQTVSGTNGNGAIFPQVDTNGTILFPDAGGVTSIILKTGVITASFANNVVGSGGFKATDESVSGLYKIIYDSTSKAINVYKNNHFLQKIGLKGSQWTSLQFASVSISPDGKYITLAGDDSTNAIDRIVLFQGS